MSIMSQINSDNLRNNEAQCKEVKEVSWVLMSWWHNRQILEMLKFISQKMIWELLFILYAQMNKKVVLFKG